MTDQPMVATVVLRGILQLPREGVLLLQQPTGEWELPGGRLEQTEQPVAGLRREVAEETGIDAPIERPIHTHAGSEEFTVFYTCSCDTSSVELSAEHDDYAWLDPADARKRLDDQQARAVSRANPVNPFAADVL